MHLSISDALVDLLVMHLSISVPLVISYALVD